MHQINFKAKNLDISKNDEDQYYMIAIADHATDYKNYVIFQKTFNPNDLREDSMLNGIYIECNGESCYNCCNKIEFESNKLTFQIKGTIFNIDFEDITLDKEFYTFMTYIFGDLFILK